MRFEANKLRSSSFFFVKYPNFDTNSFKNDLSIIKLERDVVETDYLNYICLDRHTNTRANADVYAVGWGFTDTNFYKGRLTFFPSTFQ